MEHASPAKQSERRMLHDTLRHDGKLFNIKSTDE